MLLLFHESFTSFLNEIKVFAMINFTPTALGNYVKFKVGPGANGEGKNDDDDDGECHASLPDSFAM